MKTSFILCCFFICAGNLSCQTVMNDTAVIHQNALVIDTHTDTPLRLLSENFDVGRLHGIKESRVDFPRLRAGKVDAVFFALFTGQRPRTIENYEQAYHTANTMCDSILASISRNTDKVQLAVSPEHIMECATNMKTAICLGMENGFPLEKDIARVSEFYNKGVRYITLCHSYNNDICDASTDPAGEENHGLSDYGREVVKEMNRLGMMVDVSHISDKSFNDVIALSKAPVIASHSSVRALCNHPRNLSDDMIRALAKNGGVIQICILGAYIVPEDTLSANYLKHQQLKQKYNNWAFKNELERKAAWKEYDSIELQFPPALPFIKDLADHIDYVVRLVGVDYVGLGSDFDGGGGLADCRDVTDFPKITAELMRRGYTPQEINKIWGGNFLRVFSEVQRLANRKT